MKKPTISCVMIVKNESECLDRCLQSVKGVDEIIIVDTGSEDNTIEIAKKYTDKVYDDYKWNDNFAEARNHALQKATGDWVLSIDADEFLHSFDELRKAIDEAALDDTCLAVDVKLFAENNGQMHYFPRVFKKDSRVWWESAVHNHISVLPKRIGNVEITYGYSPAHEKDPERAFRILKKESEKPDHSPRIDFYLGREYWYRRMYAECAGQMGLYVQKSQFLPEKADAFLIMARCYWALALGNDARDACVQAIIINPNFKEAVEFMAVISGEGSGNEAWEKNAQQWRKMAETADNYGVLFVR